MGKPGEYQRRVERQHRLSEIVICLFFAGTILIMGYNLVRNIVNLNDIDSGALNTYSGDYSHSVVHTGRRSKSHVFLLDNGDRVSIDTGYLNSAIIKGHTELTFQYSAKLPTIRGFYNVASIASVDGKTIFVAVEESREHEIISIWGLSFAILIFMAILSVPLIIRILLSPAKKKRSPKESHSKKNLS